MNPSVRVLLALVATFAWSTTGSAQPSTRAVVRVDRTNLRAQPATDAEVLASLAKGDVVQVLGEEKPPGQKEIWSRVELPSRVMVWAYGPGVDKAGHVKTDKLHFRAGPGRNYSVLGTLHRGDLVVVVREFDGWLQIAPPDGAVAYVASRLLGSPAEVAAEVPAPPVTPPTTPTAVARPESAAPVAAPIASAPVTPPPTTTEPPPASQATVVPPAPSLGQAQPSATQPVPPSAVSPSPVASSSPAPATPTAAPITDEKPVVPSTPEPTVESRPLPSLPIGSPRDRASQGLPLGPTYPVLTSDPDPNRVRRIEPAPEPRRVTREGVVHKTASVQAPTDYELRNGFYSEGVIDYLYLEPQTDLRKFLGKRVHLEGQEYLDSRWVTPLVRIDSIELAP